MCTSWGPMCILMNIDRILSIANEQGASDIHLVVGQQPMVRVDTALVRIDQPELTKDDLQTQLNDMLNDTQKDQFQSQQDVDLSWETSQCRYRVNVHMQCGLPAIAMRTVKTVIPPLESLNLPPSIASLAELPRGLVLVTGDTGSGKVNNACFFALKNKRFPTATYHHA